jgi:hypothetical protein
VERISGENEPEIMVDSSLQMKKCLLFGSCDDGEA